jgi:hypothetical protein
MDGFVKLFNPFDTENLKIIAIKKALHANHPVIIGMITPPSFQLAKEFWQAREQPDTTMSAQALCIVGYDDENFGGAVEVVNQWGIHWGNKGYTWIRYEDLSRFARYGFELLNSASCIPLPETSAVIYDDRGMVIMQLVVDNKVHKITKPLKIGSKFKISIRPSSGAFAYLLIKGENEKIEPLFPSATVHPYVAQKITLPGNDAYFQLQGMPQTNKLYLIISKRQFSHSEITSKIENGSLVLRIGSNLQMEIDPSMKDIVQVAQIELDQY